MSDEPKIYIPAEEAINVWSHFAGVLLAIPGAIALFVHSSGPVAWIGAAVYIVSMVILFGGSALYHHAKEPELRRRRRVLDHAAIYFLIAGTYTPLMLLGVPNIWGYSVLAFVWLCGIVGVIFEFLHYKPFRGFSILLYILMGWAVVAILPMTLRHIGWGSFAYLLAGGIAYTAGVPFYVCRKNYMHAAWHFFVLAGAILHYTAILMIFCR